jgi:hypothetical protein
MAHVRSVATASGLEVDILVDLGEAWSIALRHG